MTHNMEKLLEAIKNVQLYKKARAEKRKEFKEALELEPEFASINDDLVSAKERMKLLKDRVNEEIGLLDDVKEINEQINAYQAVVEHMTFELIKSGEIDPWADKISDDIPFKPRVSVSYKQLSLF